MYSHVPAHSACLILHRDRPWSMFTCHLQISSQHITHRSYNMYKHISIFNSQGLRLVNMSPTNHISLNTHTTCTLGAGPRFQQSYEYVHTGRSWSPVDAARRPVFIPAGLITPNRQSYKHTHICTGRHTSICGNGAHRSVLFKCSRVTYESEHTRSHEAHAS